MRPSAIVNVVDVDGAYTAGDVIQADGTKHPALIELLFGKPTGVAVFVSPTAEWMIREVGAPPCWEPLVEHWLPEHERRPSVSLSDATIFPLRVRFRRPHLINEQPREFLIKGDGSMSNSVAP